MTEEITYDGVTFDVEFDYQPEEAEVTYDSNGTGYPGCAESIDIYKISHKGTDFTLFLDGWNHIFEAEVKEKMRRDAEYYNEP